jgi:hypothetical protein
VQLLQEAKEYRRDFERSPAASTPPRRIVTRAQ